MNPIGLTTNSVPMAVSRFSVNFFNFSKNKKNEHFGRFVTVSVLNKRDNTTFSHSCNFFTSFAAAKINKLMVNLKMKTI